MNWWEKRLPTRFYPLLFDFDSRVFDGKKVFPHFSSSLSLSLSLSLSPGAEEHTKKERLRSPECSFESKTRAELRTPSQSPGNDSSLIHYRRWRVGALLHRRRGNSGRRAEPHQPDHHPDDARHVRRRGAPLLCGSLSENARTSLACVPLAARRALRRNPHSSSERGRETDDSRNTKRGADSLARSSDGGGVENAKLSSADASSRVRISSDSREPERSQTRCGNVFWSQRMSPHCRRSFIFLGSRYSAKQCFGAATILGGATQRGPGPHGDIFLTCWENNF